LFRSASPFSAEKKTNRHLLFGGCSTASHQPQEERFAEINHFVRLPFHARILLFCGSFLTSFNSQSAVAVSDRNTATHSSKKAFYHWNI
jgi:hypothetical protein